MSSTAFSKCSGGNKATDNDRASTGMDTGNAWLDVVLVVGGVEFHESSHFLRASSDYFEAAFRSGMKEAQTKRFEFPDNDPKEWKLVKSFLEPLCTATVTTANAEKLLSWFDELCMPKGLLLCDDKLDRLSAKSFKQTNVSSYDETRVDLALKHLSISVRYRLPLTKATCSDFILKQLQQSSLVKFATSEKNLRSLFAVMHDDDFCRNKFWSRVSGYFPAAKKKAEQVKMLSNNLLPALVASKVHEESLVSSTQNCYVSKSVPKRALDPAEMVIVLCGLVLLYGVALLPKI